MGRTRYSPGIHCLRVQSVLHVGFIAQAPQPQEGLFISLARPDQLAGTRALVFLGTVVFAPAEDFEAEAASLWMLSDTAIADDQSDRLGFRAYARALAGLISHPEGIRCVLND